MRSGLVQGLRNERRSGDLAAQHRRREDERGVRASHAGSGDTLATGLGASLFIYEEDGGTYVASASNSWSLAPGIWSLRQVVVNNPVGTTSKSVFVQVSAPANNTGNCYYVDEIKLGHY